MSNKTAFIAGASSGMGRALAEKLAVKGYNLQIASRNLTALEELRSRVESQCPSVSVSVVVIDITQAGFIREFRKKMSTLPEPSMAVCCAGYLGSDPHDFSETDEMDRIVATNFSGCIQLVGYFADVFRKRGSGLIAGLSSVAGERGKSKNLLYSSAKAGFTAFLDGLRNYLYPFGVHVVTIKPGYVSTPMTRHLSLPKKLTISPEKASELIYTALMKKKNIAFIPSKWKFITTAIRMIPENRYKKRKF